jgi:hypothetical protein
MRYPEWKELRDFKEKVQLKVGLKFANPPQFKDALKLFTPTCKTRRREYRPFIRKNVVGKYMHPGRTTRSISR